MTEYERVQAEYKAWRKDVMFADASDGFAAGWLAAKEDTKRLLAERAADVASRPPLPTFDEWYVARNGYSFSRGAGRTISEHMLDLSTNLRAYVSEMVRRK